MKSEELINTRNYKSNQTSSKIIELKNSGSVVEPA